MAKKKNLEKRLEKGEPWYYLAVGDKAMIMVKHYGEQYYHKTGIVTYVEMQSRLAKVKIKLDETQEEIEIQEGYASRLEYAKPPYHLMED